MFSVFVCIPGQFAVEFTKPNTSFLPGWLSTTIDVLGIMFMQFDTQCSGDNFYENPNAPTLNTGLLVILS